ncbi:MAG: hypothetical protein P8X86_21265 [Desulfofustis sp.]
MPEYRLAYAVKDLEGNQLLPAGTKLTRQVMKDLATREKRSSTGYCWAVFWHCWHSD